MFISVDPGKNVGVATFNSDGTDRIKKSMSIEAFREFLSMVYSIPDLNNLTFIMEDFKLRHDKAIDQTGSDMPASRCIGAVEQIVTMMGDRATIELQRPGILSGALKWAGYAHLANKGHRYHVPDEISAYAHGCYYLINAGLKTHPIFK